MLTGNLNNTTCTIHGVQGFFFIFWQIAIYTKLIGFSPSTCVYTKVSTGFILVACGKQMRLIMSIHRKNCSKPRKSVTNNSNSSFFLFFFSSLFFLIFFSYHPPPSNLSLLTYVYRSIYPQNVFSRLFSVFCISSNTLHFYNYEF